MKKNAMFSYLSIYEDAQPQTDSTGQRFIIIPSPPPTSGSIRGVNTHVTIYEFYDPQQDCLSALHYSAYYNEVSTDAQYRLHIYYDASGNIQEGPLLSINSGNNWQKTPMTTFRNQESNINLFLSHAMAIAPHIIQDTHSRILRAQKQIAGNELTLKSQYFSIPHTQYEQKKKTLLNWIKNLEQQIAINEKSSHLISVIIHLKRIKSDLDQQRMLTQRQASTAKKTEPKEPSQQNPIVEAAKAKKSQSTSSVKTLLAELKTNQERFNNIKPDNAAIVLKELMIWLLGIDEPLMAHLNMEAKEEILKFYKQVDDAGWQHYRDILFTPGPINLDGLESLRIFDDHLGETEYLDAVKLKDVDRISYIVEQNQSLLTSPLKLGKKTHYNNLVHYCIALLQSGNEENLQFITACIQLVVNKGYSSLLITQMNQEVHTFLEWILCQPPTHPLNQIIVNSNLLEDLGTYISLKDALVSIDKTLLTESLQRKIDLKISLYTSNIRFYSIQNQFALKMLKKNNLLSQQTKCLSQDERLRITSDEEMLVEVSRSLELGAAFLETIPEQFQKDMIAQMDGEKSTTENGPSQLPAEIQTWNYQQKRDFILNHIKHGNLALQASIPKIKLFFSTQLLMPSRQLSTQSNAFFNRRPTSASSPATAHDPLETQPENDDCKIQ